MGTDASRPGRSDRRGLHVGLGNPAHCVTCSQPWPCAGDDVEDLAALHVLFGQGPLDAEAAIAENVKLGYMEHAGTSTSGEPIYRLTPAGEKHVEAMIADQAGTTVQQSDD